MPQSDSSALSSPPSTDDEAVAKAVDSSIGLKKWFKPAPKVVAPKAPSSPPLPKRAPSPPHEYVLADNPDIAFIVTFRSRFSHVFPGKLPHYGPQDIERGVSDSVPSEQIERLLCTLLGLVLNRKKDIEKGHYQRALEEAIQTHSGQWPRAWEGKNPLHGGGNFNNMTPVERLTLLKALILWSLHSSDAVLATLKESYKQNRHEDDVNQPLSVQPWGRDGYKRRYWLIEGQDDTHFRVYRESNPALKNNTWWSVAGSIEEVQALAAKLEEDPSQHARSLREKMRAAIPRFEAGEEKRKRRDYRLARKAQFTRPEPGFSLYEGRTRGKRMKYTFSDDEDTSDAFSTRRSNRPSGISTPAESTGPTVTASGRQVKSRVGGLYGESMLVDQRKELEHGTPDIDGTDNEDHERGDSSRAQRTGSKLGNGGWRKGTDHIEDYNSVDEMDEESDAASSGHDWEGDDDDDEDGNNFAGDDEAEDEMSENDSLSEDEQDLDNEPESLVVQLRYRRGGQSGRGTPITSQDASSPAAPAIASLSIKAEIIPPAQLSVEQPNGLQVPPVPQAKEETISPPQPSVEQPNGLQAPYSPLQDLPQAATHPIKQANESTEKMPSEPHLASAQSAQPVQPNGHFEDTVE